MVVGAGVTGLALGYRLSRLGVKHLVLESEDRPGGVIRTVRREARTLELGPQRTRLVPEVAELVEELELSDRLLEAPEDLPLFVYRDGALRRVPASVSGFLSTELLSLRGKLRVLAEPLTGRTRRGESVAGFLRRKFGEEAYEALLGPLYGGIYGSDPEEMLVELSLGRALERIGVGRSLLASVLRWMAGGADRPPACSFRGGLGRLVDALHEGDRRDVRLGTPAVGLRGEPGRWTVETSEGSVASEAVVLTLPADRAAPLLAGVAPKAAERIGRLRYNDLALAHLLSEERAGRAPAPGKAGRDGAGSQETAAPNRRARPRGFGYQVAFGEGLATRGVTWNDALFGDEDPERRGVYTAYLGGMGREEVLARPDEELGRIAAGEFESVTGRPARALHVSRTRMPAWDASWSAIEGLELPEELHVCASWSSRPGIPGRLEEAAALAERLS